MKKKLGIMFLVLSALLIIPIAAHAAEIIDSGFCGAEGDNLTWTLDDEGTLTISGMGEMEDAYQWQMYIKTDKINKVIINDGVTSIGDQEFDIFVNMTDITISNGVKSIGRAAFSDCVNLKKIEIPASVTSIGDYAFFSCGSLSIDVSSENKQYLSIDGVLFNKEKTEILAYSKDKIQSEYTIPESVTNIAEGAFGGCSCLTNVVIPNSVTNIGKYAFYLCDALTSIHMANNLTYIGDFAFYDCENLKFVYYTGNVEQWNNMSIQKGNECLTNADIHFAENNISASEISVTNNTISVRTNLDNLMPEDREKAEVFAALYDENDVLIDAYTAVYDGADIVSELKYSDKADHIKVFVWNKDGSLEPITDVPEVIDVSSVTPPPDPAEIQGIAFIANIGVENDAVKVDYYQDGVLKTALTSPDFNDPDITRNTQPGTLVNLKISDGLIVSADPYISFYGEILSDITSGRDGAGIPVIDQIYNASVGEEAYFGAIVGKEGGTLYIAPMTSGDYYPDMTNVQTVSTENKESICYVYDSAKAIASRCGIGSVDEITVDPYLAGDMGVSTGHIINCGSFSGTNPIPGMLDYAYVLKRGLKTEIVVYKQRPYTYEVK